MRLKYSCYFFSASRSSPKEASFQNKRRKKFHFDQGCTGVQNKQHALMRARFYFCNIANVMGETSATLVMSQKCWGTQ